VVVAKAKVSAVYLDHERLEGGFCVPSQPGYQPVATKSEASLELVLLVLPVVAAALVAFGGERRAQVGAEKAVGEMARAPKRDIKVGVYMVPDERQKERKVG